MRITEARWIAQQLAALPASRISPLVNVGSSTAEFRERRQPHIDRLIFKPLLAAGVEVIHTDMKLDAGVDIAGDLMEPRVQTRIRERRPRAVLCSNLLEHVRDPARFAQVIGSLVEPGGVLLVTVPRSYPYHADPIDTGFRPSPSQLAELFPSCQVLHAEVVADTTYGQELISQGRKGVRKLVGALRPWGEAARAQRDRLRWLLRPFETSCILVAVQ